MNYLSCARVNDYVEDITATFTALAKIYSTDYTKVAGLGEVFVKQKFSHVYGIFYFVDMC